jgi:hypothetical protein
MRVEGRGLLRVRHHLGRRLTNRRIARALDRTIGEALR